MLQGGKQVGFDLESGGEGLEVGEVGFCLL